jgi:hypothetical protein
MTARRRIGAALALATLVVGCRGGTQVPEDGALLLRISLAAGAAMPDELRLSAYDDTGPLWSNARFPPEGPLMPQSSTFLGTILLQPGTTVGNLRIDLRGIRNGAIADETTLTIPPADRAGATFDLSLSAALLSDADGDGVPDPIDDCPALPDPDQTGCPRDAGAGGGAGGMAGGGQAGAAGGAGGSSKLPQGAPCGAASQCATGFCKDGACCDSACTDACNSCTTGTCTHVTSGEDAPECVAPMTCNPKGKCVGN